MGVVDRLNDDRTRQVVVGGPVVLHVEEGEGDWQEEGQGEALHHCPAKCPKEA